MELDFNCKFEFDNFKEISGKNLSLKKIGKSVLFVVDMNRGFAIEGALSSPRIKNIIPQVVRTTKCFADKKAPIVAFTDAHSEKAAEFGYLPVHCVKNTSESELVDELLPFKEDMTIIGKNSTNGFMEEKTQELIKNFIDSGYKNWVITGCCTDICVKTFAITLKTYFNKNDFDARIIVPTDAVETYDAPGHDAAAMNLFSLYDMQMNGITLVESVTE